MCKLDLNLYEPTRKNENILCPVRKNYGPVHINHVPVHINHGPVRINYGPVCINHDPVCINYGPVLINYGYPTLPLTKNIMKNLSKHEVLY